MAGLRLLAVPAAWRRRGSCSRLPESQTVQPCLTSFQIMVQSPHASVWHVAGWPALPAGSGTAEQWLWRPRYCRVLGAGCWVLRPERDPDPPWVPEGI